MARLDWIKGSSVGSDSHGTPKNLAFKKMFPFVLCQVSTASIRCDIVDDSRCQFYGRMIEHEVVESWEMVAKDLFESNTNRRLCSVFADCSHAKDTVRFTVTNLTYTESIDTT